MFEQLVDALLPSKAPKAERGKWIGAKDAVDYMGLLSAVRGRVSVLCEPWLRELAGGAAVSGQDFLNVVEPDMSFVCWVQWRD